MAVKGFKTLLLRTDVKELYEVAKLAMEDHLGVSIKHSAFVLMMCRMVQERCNDAALEQALIDLDEARKNS